MAQAWLKSTFRTVYQSIACAHWTFLSVNFPLVSLHCNAFHVRPLGFMLVIFKPKKSAFCEEMAARHTTDHTLHNCSILLTHSPSQSAPTILVYQVNLIFFLGSGTLKIQVQNMDLKKAGWKKLGHCYLKRGEARLLLLFLNNNDPDFSHPAFIRSIFWTWFF